MASIIGVAYCNCSLKMVEKTAMLDATTRPGELLTWIRVCTEILQRRWQVDFSTLGFRGQDSPRSCQPSHT